MIDLKDVRNKIDIIDDQLSDLYLKRMELCKEVGVIKAETGKAVHDGNREKEIVDRLSQKMPEDMRIYLKELYDAIFYTSKAYQSGYIKKSSPVKDEVDAIVANGLKDFPIDGTAACLGVYGDNGSTAVEKIFHISNITYFKSYDGVFNAVEKGLCEFGVLPVENNFEVYDLMEKYDFHIVKSVRVQDSENGNTRLICITKNLRIYNGADKISIMISSEHMSVSLNKIVSLFYADGLNLIKMESRRIESSDSEFKLYLEFEGDITDPKVRNLIAELDNSSDKFVMLGCYKESI